MSACVVEYFISIKESRFGAVAAIRQELATNIPVIINSADHSDEIREQVIENGYIFINKPAALTLY